MTSTVPSPGRSARRPLPWGLLALLVLLAALAGVVGWQTWAGLDHIDRMMAERSRTLYRMVATEVRNVARYGAARLERLDEVLGEVTAGGDVVGVSLERLGGGVALARGEFPDPLPAYDPDGRSYVLDGEALVIAGPATIVTQGCSGCASCGAAESACPAAGSRTIDGDYVVLLALDARPYLVLQRGVWLQTLAATVLLLGLVGGLLAYRGQLRRGARMGEALAVADERARALERLSRVAGGLAHEIKNPVGSLRGFAQLLAERAAPGSKEAEYAGLMVAELDGITRRIDRLRDYARPAPPEPKPARPNEMIRRVAALLEPDLAARALRLTLELPADPGPEAQLDEERFRDLVVNLVMNAIEASPEGGTVTVRLTAVERDERLVLEVLDQGPGIPPAERERALRPFHSTKPGGLGLGLAVAQQAVEDHGGRLELDQAPGGGALVRAAWPRRAGLGE
jgi:signal transduction histidine kinase